MFFAPQILWSLFQDCISTDCTYVIFFLNCSPAHLSCGGLWGPSLPKATAGLFPFALCAPEVTLLHAIHFAALATFPISFPSARWCFWRRTHSYFATSRSQISRAARPRAGEVCRLPSQMLFVSWIFMWWSCHVHMAERRWRRDMDILRLGLLHWHCWECNSNSMGWIGCGCRWRGN